MKDNIKREDSSKSEYVEFDEEFLPHADALYNFAYKLTHNVDDAHDLVQEAFMKAYRFINSYEKGTNAKAWLFRILKNGFINDYRKKSKQPSKVDYNEVESYYNSEDEQSVQSTSDMRVESTKDRMGDEVAIALSSLDVEFRTIIILSDLEGFKYEEMAKILDIPLGTVRSRLHRARGLLKEKLSEYAKKMGFTK